MQGPQWTPEDIASFEHDTERLRETTQDFYDAGFFVRWFIASSLLMSFRTALWLVRHVRWLRA